MRSFGCNLFTKGFHVSALLIKIIRKLSENCVNSYQKMEHNIKMFAVFDTVLHGWVVKQSHNDITPWNSNKQTV